MCRGVYKEAQGSSVSRLVTKLGCEAGYEARAGSSLRRSVWRLVTRLGWEACYEARDGGLLRGSRWRLVLIITEYIKTVQPNIHRVRTL